MNRLYYGDNLDVMRKHLADESVDLIYLDPPFNSKASYNILFRSPKGDAPRAQRDTFKDTWRWEDGAALAFHEVMARGGPAAGILDAMHKFLGQSDVMAYLCMIAVRLIEMRRVLKPTGSLYLHCDPTASHYLKILMDGIFGAANFRNEISWKRSSAHSDSKQGMRRYGKIRDVIFFYTKSSDYTWNTSYTAYSDEYLEGDYRHEDDTGRRYKETDLTAAKPGGETEYEWHVKRPRAGKHRWQPDFDEEFANPRPGWEYKSVLPYRGRYWAFSKENMAEFAKSGKLIHRETGMPRLKQFADEMLGVPLQDSWHDITPAAGAERIGYATQKPLALLQRIINVSSGPGDLVLDPFCGCGTALEAAHKYGRQWIGIDVAYEAMMVIEARLKAAFKNIARDRDYEVEGIPRDMTAARALAKDDPYAFQAWMVSLVRGGQPHGAKEDGNRVKKGADRGIDGIVYFLTGRQSTGFAVISVKGTAKVSVQMVRDLRGVMEREGADIGLFLTLTEPTRDMRSEAAAAGMVEIGDGKYHRLQIRTAEELLKGAEPKLPPVFDLSTLIGMPNVLAGRRKATPRRIREQIEMLMTIEGGQISPRQRAAETSDAARAGSAKQPSTAAHSRKRASAG